MKQRAKQRIKEIYQEVINMNKYSVNNGLDLLNMIDEVELLAKKLNDKVLIDNIYQTKTKQVPEFKRKNLTPEEQTKEFHNIRRNFENDILYYNQLD